MGVRVLEGAEVALAEHVENEEVVSLADDVSGDAAGLLRDEDRAELVFPALLGELDESVHVLAATDDRLGFLDGEHDLEQVLVPADKVPLVLVEEIGDDCRAELECCS